MPPDPPSFQGFLLFVTGTPGVCSIFSLYMCVRVDLISLLCVCAIFLCVNICQCVFLSCVDLISSCVCVCHFSLCEYVSVRFCLVCGCNLFLCVCVCHFSLCDIYISVCFCLSLLDAIGIACLNHLRPQPPQSAIKNKECIKVSGVEQASPWVIGIHLCSCTLILVCGVVQIQFWDVLIIDRHSGIPTTRCIFLVFLVLS